MRLRHLRRLLLAGCAAIVAGSAAADPLLDGFRDPPNSARPRVWWHWMNGNITQEGVDLDLAWMKRVGIGGFQNFDAALATPQVVEKRLVYMSPEWKAVFRHTAERADQLGLEMAIASSPGWSETGGPWVKPEQAMKKLVWSQTTIEGGRRFHGVLKSPPTTTGPFQGVPTESGIMGHQSDKPQPTYYADAAVIAYRDAAPAKPPAKPVVTFSGGAIDGAALSDDDLTTSVKLPTAHGKPTWILYDFGAPQTMRAATVALAAKVSFGTPAPYFHLEASDDGVSFRTIAALPIDQAPQQTASFAPVTARYFRLVQDSPPNSSFLADFLGGAAPGIDVFGMMASMAPAGASAAMMGAPVQLAEFSLSAAPKVNQFELKAGFGVVKDYYTLEAADRAGVAGTPPADVIDLTGRMGADGRLDWTPPRGRWTVLRMGYSLTGTENHPATIEATGLEVDKLNAADVKTYIDTYLDNYAEILGPDLMGKHGVRALLNDSTEVGPQNWTNDILEQFQKRRGYDPRPWLPTMTGAVIGDGVKSDAFLYDFRKTLAELTAENHYSVVADAAHARGLINYGEALEDGRPSLGDDMEMRRYTTIPMAAMWTYNPAKGPKPTYLADIRGAASVAHIYGQNLVAAESMTASLSPWNFAPRDLKPVIDLEFALGVNRPVVHTSVHQPLVDKKPGLSLAIFGQYFNRNETWAEQARPWVDYMARNAFMLQQGRFFADVAFFEGEEAPLTGLYGEHLMPDAPHGYGFDFINAEMLAHRLSVQDGALVAPSGARYRLLYLGGSSRKMTLATLRRIDELVHAGAVAAGERPVTSPGLADDAAAFNALADSLWSPGQSVRSVGLGRMITASNPDDALAAMNLARDFDDGQPDAKVMFVHRKLADCDLYYVDNRETKPLQLDARFRVIGTAPELWRAETGAAQPVSYQISGNATAVPLNLAPNEAVYVVFRKPAAAPSATLAPPVETVLKTLDGPWQVSFEPGRAAPATARFDHLASWTENADPGVKYFSGAATYAHDLTVTRADLRTAGRIVLDLGDVRDLAEVRVNGTLVAAPWHPPYRADLTAALKPGANHLQITVVNTWVNRLIGDRQPGAPKITFTAIPAYKADAPLRPSGLIGPVRVVSVK